MAFYAMSPPQKKNESLRKSGVIPKAKALSINTPKKKELSKATIPWLSKPCPQQPPT